MKLIEVNENNFATEVLYSSVPVVVDLYSEHCGPCRILKRVLALLAEEFGSQAKIVTVDVEANQNLVADYAVDSVPTVLLLRDGKEFHRMVGLGALVDLRDALQL